MKPLETVIIRSLGQQEYLPLWQAMQHFTATRNENTLDEIWLLEHPPVFTQGQNGKPEHILNPGNIPVIRVDRGGQVTYHGPGQLVAYTLIDLKRKKFHIRDLVSRLEKSVIDLLNAFHLSGTADPKAPGVYVNHAKICSIGLRVRRGCSYHGIAFNVAMDLSPFSRIHPCGFPALEMTQLSQLTKIKSRQVVEEKLIHYLCQNLGYNHASIEMQE